MRGRNDESGGRNDESGGRRSWEAGLASDALEALPHSSPPLWIPAFAGMTKWGWAGMTKPLWIPAFAGMTKWGGRNDDVGGRRSWEAGLASDALEALPHSSPPLWIPAFAGMTKWGAGMTKWGAGMTNGGGAPA